MPTLSVARFHSTSPVVALSGQGEVCPPGLLPFPRSSRRGGVQAGLRLLLVLIAFAASVMGLSGCGGGWGEFKPTITTQVQSQTVTVGASVTFTVAATGTGPITYQWSENGTPIPGATGLTYTMTAQASDNGAVMTAAATNAGGTSTSQGTLTVQIPPAITKQPASQTVAAGQPATFSVTATGTGPLSYQWFQNGAPISGATSSTYAIPATTPPGTSTLTVVVSNAIGHATSAAATLTVNAVPALAFAPIATQTYGAAAFPVSASSASNGAVTYAVTSGPATIAGNVVTLTGMGTVVLSANQAASGGYVASTATTSFTVNPAVPVLQFSSIPGVTVGTPFAPSASSASSGAITYSVISGPATIAGVNVTVTGQGTVVLGASQAASGNYASATATTTVVAGAQTPNLVFVPVASQKVGAAPFTVSATSASSGAVTYSVVSGPATISGNLVTVTGSGTVVLAANQATAPGYNSAQASTSFTVSTDSATLAFAPIAAQTYGNAPFAVSATSASAGTVTYAVVSGPATISGNTVTMTGVGIVALSARQAANGSYAAATANTTFTVNAATPTLTFAPIPAQTAGGAPFAVTASSASSGAVTYGVVSGPATISGNTVTTTGSGTVVLSASQAAAGNYASAAASVSVLVGTQTATLAFAPITAQTYGNAPFTVSAASTSPGAVSYAVVSGPATISGNTVTITGTGPVILSATQAASGSYASSTANTTFSVSAATPTLAFAPIAAQTAGGAPFTVNATSASPGAVTYTVVSGPATISGNIVTTTGSGTVVLSATQAAAGNYASATASVSVPVGAQSPTLAFAPIAAQTYGNAPFTVSATSASPGAVTYAVVSGPATVSGNTVTLTGTGTVALSATQAATGSYAAATANTSFPVAAATPSLVFATVPQHSVGDPPFAVSATSASSGAVTYSVVSGPATIAGNLVTLTGSGNVVLAASQVAAGNYGAATASVTLAAGTATPTLTFAPIGSHSYGDAPFTVIATSVSSGAVTYNVISGPATISGNTVTVTGAGTVILGASQAAAGGYIAVNATTTFSVGAELPNLSFAPIGTQTYGSAPITVSATSASNGTVTYAVVSGPASVSGSTVTTTGLGTVILSASQAASGSYAPATATTNFNVVAATPSLAFAPIAAHTFGDAPFMVSASSASNGAITYTVVSGPATIAGSTVTITGSGPVVLSASQAANGDYTAATAQANFSVASATSTLTFAPIAQHTYGDSAFAVSASSASSGPVVYAVQSGPATISGSTVSLTGTGTVILIANQAASGSYAAAAQATTSFAVVPAKPTLTFAPIPPQTFGGAPFTVSASSVSTGAITYSVVSGPATIVGQTVAVTADGSIILGASQAADANYTATSTTTIVNVGVATPNLQFTPIAAQTYGNSPFTVSASSASSGAVTYAVQSGPATISGNTVTITGAGTIVVTANQAQAPGYGAASATTSVSVAVNSPTLAFAPIPTHTYGDASFPVTASSASSGTVTYSVQSGPATISGNTVTLTGTGNVVLSASQAATANYAASSATTNFNVNAETPTLTFASIPAHAYGDASFSVSATSASPGPVVYAVQSGPATISGNTVTLTGTGTVVLTANQAPSGNYAAAAQVTTSFAVNAASATLTFTAIPAHTYGDAPFTVSASSASSAPVVYAVQSGPATISGNTVTLNAIGTVVLTANQAASGNYAAATQATVSFAVNAATPNIVFSVANQAFSTTPFTVNATSNSPGAFTYSVQSGPAAISGNSVTLSGAGTVVLLASQAANGNYAAATQTATFTVSAIAPTLTFSVANQTYGAAPFTVNATTNSPGTVTYSVVSGPATVSGNTVTLTGVGTVQLQASVAASGGYSSLATTATFTVAGQAPSLKLSVPDQTYSTTPFTVQATSSSPGTITYSIANGDPATVTSNSNNTGSVTMSGVGTVHITANQAASGNYAAASVSTTFAISPIAPTLTLSVPGQTFSTTPFTVQAQSNSSGAITYSIASGDPATVTGGSNNTGNVTMTGAGTVHITATQAAAGAYTGATATTTFTISPITPTLKFSVPAQTYSSTPFNVQATSNSTGAITYAITSGDPATVTNGSNNIGSVTMGGAGTVHITATQVAANGYTGTSVTTTFTISPIAPTLTFTVPAQTYSTTPFNVQAQSNSSGAITYAITSGDPSTVANGSNNIGSVTMTGAGTVHITATLAAAGGYTGATATTTFTISPIAPTLTLSVPAQNYSSTPFTVQAQSNSSGAITYSIMSGDPSTVTNGSNNTGSVIMSGAGTVHITATLAAAGGYTGATATTTFTISPIAPTLTLSVPAQNYSSTPFNVQAQSNSTGAITYSITSGDPATVTSGSNNVGSVTMTGAGTVHITATQIAAGGYTGATVTTTFTISPIAPTLTLSVPDQTYSSTPFNVQAASNSTGAITYSISGGDPATVTSGSNNIGSVAMTGAGTVHITATLAAAGGYNGASVTTTFNITPITPTLKFSVPAQTYSSTPFNVQATSNSTGSITYAITSGDPATVTNGSNNTGSVTMTGAGTVHITATQVAAGGYSGTSATTTFTISAIAPTITLSVPAQTYSTTPFAVQAQSNSTGSITYAITSGDPASVTNGSNNTGSVTMSSAGTVHITATQVAAGGYTGASVTTTFTISTAAPTITFNVPTQTYGEAPFTVGATSNSQGTITYSVVSGPATINGTTVTLKGAGTVQLLASQAAAGGYLAGTANATFTVNGQAPTLAFSVANQTYSPTAFTVAASSNSAGAFTYSINSGPATVSGSSVTMTGTGTVSITATEAAAGNYAAGSVTTSFTISAATPTVNFVVPNKTYGAAPFAVQATSPSSGAYTYTLVSGPARISNNTVTVTGTGTVVLKATEAAADPYLTASATASFTVTQNVAITPITPANQTFETGSVVTFNATATGGQTNNLTWTATAGTFTGNVWTAPTTSGTYTITATSVDESSVSVSTTVTVGKLAIIKQPVSQSVCVGATATFSVTAVAASGTPTYQWLFNGTAIQGATSSAYFIASAQTSNAGSYSVKVIDTSLGTSVTSNNAMLAVGSSISSNPISATIYTTQTATFSVGMSGDGPFHYQWYSVPANSPTGTTGTAIPGATSSGYTLTSATTANNGTMYYVVVTDACGTALKSTSATLTVINGNAPPTINQQPSNVTTPVGGTPSFSVVATGTGLSYQWYTIPAGSPQGTKALVTGATSATYTLPTTATTISNDQDQYFVIVTNSYGQAVSFPATLTVGNGIAITQQPQSVYINPGQSATFSVTASSTQPLTYQWYEAEPGSSTFVAIPGAVNSSFTFDAATEDDSNTVFYVVVSNGGVTESVTSTSAAMFVTPLQGIPLCSQSWNTVGTTVPVNPTSSPNGVKSPNGLTYGNNCAWELTSSQQVQEGNIVWPSLISTSNIQLQFTIAVSNPSNPAADGFTMLLGDPSLGATPTSKGATGQGMGAEGIPGFVLAFDDYENPGDPPIPYLGVGRGETALWENPYTYTNTTIPALATQGSTVSHNYIVSIVQGYMTVSMDGTQVFSGQVSVPPVAYLYFTSSTGSYYETTVVSNVQATVSVP